jgi:D-alanine-D-alanine ligase
VRIAITHNLRVTDNVDEAVFASRETVESLVEAVTKAGHHAVAVEVSGPVREILRELAEHDPDLVFNIAEGWADSARQSFYTSLYARLGLPHTGSGPLVQALAMDKHLTKLAVRERGVLTPGWCFVREPGQPDLSGLRYPVVVKPNAEGTSRGITQRSVARTESEALVRTAELLAQYPDGVLVEEFIAGRELTVPYLAAVDNEFEGVLHPIEIVLRPRGAGEHNILDYSFKNYQRMPLNMPAPRVEFQVPARLPEEVEREVRRAALAAVRTLGCQDIARVDFRLGEDAQPYLLEVNTLPGLDPGLSIHRAAALAGLASQYGVVHAVLDSAIARHGLAPS